MKRKIYQDLLKWKQSAFRKPLLLRGARRVGKTYVVMLFGIGEYANVIYCNFTRDVKLRGFFDNLDPKKVFNELKMYKRKEIMPGHSLIIFDEVQDCPRALTFLKYVCEEANDYHIIAISSILEPPNDYKGKWSSPVGKVNLMTVYPMDFEEFLLANGGNYQDLVNEIHRCFDKNEPMMTAIHENLLEMYRKYLYIGGMPEVVDMFIKTQNYELARIKQNEIIDTYLTDMSKYNRRIEATKTSLIYTNISRQLTKENKKFQYKFLRPGARASNYAEAVEWLTMTGIANRVYRIEKISLPLKANTSLLDFKLYANDVGLCSANQNSLVEDILFENGSDPKFIDGLVENYVNNHLMINKLERYYWKSKYDAEIQFITRINLDIIPIEVKPSDNVKSKSLSVYMQKFKPKYAIRISAKNFGFENNIKSVPLYATFCIKQHD